MTDFEPANNNSQERIIRAGEVFARFTTSLSSNYPHKSYSIDAPLDPSYKERELSGEQKQYIEKLRRYSCDEIVAGIFENPPAVYRDVSENENQVRLVSVKPKGKIEFIPSTGENLFIAGQKTDISEWALDAETQDQLQKYIDLCQTYLRSPIINDHFDDNNDRRDWERGVFDSLNMIDKNWSQAFMDKWYSSRYSKNRQTPIINKGEILTESEYNLPYTLTLRLQDITKKMRESRDKFLGGDYSGITDLSLQCTRVINIFTEEGINMRQLISEMFNNLLTSATSGLPVKPDALQFIQKNADFEDILEGILRHSPYSNQVFLPDSNTKRIASAKIPIVWQGRLGNIFDEIRNYLVMPTFFDNFVDNKERLGSYDTTKSLIPNASWKQRYDDFIRNNKSNPDAYDSLFKSLEKLSQLDLPVFITDKIKAILSNQCILTNEDFLSNGQVKKESIDQITEISKKIIILFNEELFGRINDINA